MITIYLILIFNSDFLNKCDSKSLFIIINSIVKLLSAADGRGSSSVVVGSRY